MIRTVLFFTFFWLYQIVVIPLQLVIILLDKIGRHRSARVMASRISASWAQGLLWISGIKLKIHGKIELPYEQAALIVSNHQGDFDIPILLGYMRRPVGFIAKIEMTKLIGVSTWMNYIGCVFIDRENRRQSLQAIRQAIKILKDGTSLVVFPEGTRSNGPEMGPFKTGSINIAIKAGVPIVPLTMSGSYKIKSKGALRIVPSEIDVYIGNPISTDSLGKEDNMTEVVREIIQSNLDL